MTLASLFTIVTSFIIQATGLSQLSSKGTFCGGDTLTDSAESQNSRSKQPLQRSVATVLADPKEEFFFQTEPLNWCVTELGHHRWQVRTPGPVKALACFGFSICFEPFASCPDVISFSNSVKSLLASYNCRVLLMSDVEKTFLARSRRWIFFVRFVSPT